MKRSLGGGDTPFVKPNVSYCIEENEVHYNPWSWADEYLTFVALENGTFSFTSSNSLNVINYSTDNGTTWTEGDDFRTSVEVNNGDKVMWKGTLTPQNDIGIGRFSSSGNFDVQGNVMSLLYGDDFKGQTDLSDKTEVFAALFSDNNIINAKNLSLPATTLSEGCYKEMFHHCEWLETAPVLPATTLVNGCYDFMFNECYSLKYIKAMFTTSPVGDYTTAWVYGVAETGTFVKNSAATWDDTGDYAIPSGWTVVTE